jgi:trehalose-6-phosphate hydrolase
MNRLAQQDAQRARALVALLLTARGVPFIYYGEEIGMQNIEARAFDEIIDIQARIQYGLALERGLSEQEALEEANKHNRDRSRSPMQWDDSKNSGFSQGASWIRINENYRDVNVKTQLPISESLINTYRALIALRNNEKVLQRGVYETLELKEGRIHFSRTYGRDRVAVVVNFSSAIELEIPKSAKILMGSTVLKPNEFVIYRH